jgi:hypothetical protein
MIYTYFDAILAPQATDDYETRAIADVNSLGYTNTTETKYMYQQLVIFRCYQIMAVELSTDSGDIYAQKVSHYKKEYEAVATQYKNAIMVTNPPVNGSSTKSIAWGRG